MKKLQSTQVRSTYNRTIILCLLLLLPLVSSAQTGVFWDQGGAVFNVKAYGATGGGSSDDTAGIQNAINAAITANGGVVYFPAGSYLLDGTLSNNRGDIVSLVGSGTGTRLIVNSNLGISFASIGTTVASDGFHSSRIQSMHISCTNSATGIAVQMTDMIAAPQLNDLTVSTCNQAFDFINQNQWTERINANGITDDYNNHLFHFDQNPGDTDNSYGYGTYHGIYINKSSGQDVFYLTGGAYLYHSTFEIKGNFASNATGASIFNAHGAPGQPCPSAYANLYDIAVEGGSYSVVNASNNGCSGGASGNAIVGGIGAFSANGSVAGSNDFTLNLYSAAYLVASFTASGSSSDTVSAASINPYTTSCYVQPTNATAAATIAGTYVSGTNWGAAYVAHSSAAGGGKFQLWCTF